MPPAGSGRPLHSNLLPASSRRSLPVRKSFPRDAEGYCGEAACFPPAANARALDPGRLPASSRRSLSINNVFNHFRAVGIHCHPFSVFPAHWSCGSMCGS
ncbi:MAG: hypothetical protein LBQ54_14425 [Planctomycetaceae bacterium]|nr:hypothetical protein [Planctomycetaceae bacterium]